MNNMKKLIGIISIIAIIVCAIAACNPFPPDPDDTDPISPTTSPTNVAVTGVSLKSASSLVVGGTETLHAVIDPPDATNKNVTWNSSNSSVATVSANGTVTAVAAGIASITVTTVDGNKTAGCNISVVTSAIAVTGVNLNKSSISLNVGDTETLNPTITPSGATNQNVTWSSGNTSVATVSTGGLVTAVAAGTATITVSTVDGNRTASCNVTVTSSAPANTFTTIADMAAWLSNQPANSAASPYAVKLNVSDLGGRSGISGSAGKALIDNSDKYVNLDLSGSTFTGIENNTFESCDSLTNVTIPDKRKMTHFTQLQG